MNCETCFVRDDCSRGIVHNCPDSGHETYYTQDRPDDDIIVPLTEERITEILKSHNLPYSFTHRHIFRLGHDIKV